MLDRGWERVRRLLDLNAYIGAALVSLNAYTAMVKRQGELRPPVNPDAIRAACADLVLSDTTPQVLGVAANPRRSLFITSAPGNGKTSIARALRVSNITPVLGHGGPGGRTWGPCHRSPSSPSPAVPGLSDRRLEWPATTASVLTARRRSTKHVSILMSRSTYGSHVLVGSSPLSVFRPRIATWLRPIFLVQCP
jgi:hypothetical protein